MYLNERVIEIVDILEGKGIEIGTILRKKLRKYYEYYIVVGYHKMTELLVTLRFYKTMPKNPKEILCYCNQGACENETISCWIEPFVLNKYEVVGKVEDRIIANIKYYLSDYAKDYIDLLNYSEILKNLKIGSVICYNNIETVICIAMDNEGYTFLSLIEPSNKLEKDEIINSLIKDSIREIRLNTLSTFNYRSKYVLDIEEDIIKNVVMKLKLLKKI